MGKAAITRTKTAANANSTNLIHKMKTQKKKGRPSLADLQKRQLKSLASSQSPNSDNNNNSIPSRRSTRRRNSGNDDFISSEFISDEYDDDDDERKQKKVKLVVRLPQSNQLHSGNSSSRNSASGSDSEPEEGQDHDDLIQEPTIIGVEGRSNDEVIDQGEQGFKVTEEILHGLPLDCGPTTPLPDIKLLVFILDRLQKKDTYGVFAEPVDPDELPDYHEIIEHQMDFGTLRKKLDSGAYPNLEELEADVFLICSNAMQYNAPDTVYHRQAWTIHELAKRDFANLRHEGEPKVVRRGRPPRKNKPESSPANHTEVKNVKKVIESSPVDRAGIQLSSGATLASGEDKANGSNGYNLRKGPAMYRFNSNDAYATNYSFRNGENYSEWLVDWNTEFPAKILRADMKYGKKHVQVDENRRDTYKQYQVSASSTEQPCLSNTSGDRKQLIPVGLHSDTHGYARSIARYAANLGTVAWKVASMKIRTALPDGTPFGPGWVGEDDAPPQTSFFACEKQKPINSLITHNDSSKPADHPPGLYPATAYGPPEELGEAGKKLNSQGKESEHDDLSCRTPGSSFQGQQKSVFQHNNKNGFSGMYPHDLSSSQTGISRTPAIEEGSTSYQTPTMLPKRDVSPMKSGPLFQAGSEGASSQYGNLFGRVPESIVPSVEIANRCSQQQISPMPQRPLTIPPDLNVRVPTSGSPSSSLQIGSPQQPDLALQL